MTSPAAVAQPGAAGGRAHDLADRLAGPLRRITASRVTTALLLACYFAQAAAIALVARRSIYDEDYHLNAIEYFQGGATPFEQQPEGLNNVGDLSRYGSYLYHWTFGILARVLDAVGFSEHATWITLRFVTVALMTAGLWFAWLIVRELGGTRSAANLTVALLALTPLHVYLASVVNYDGLTLPLVNAAVYLGLTIVNRPGFPVARWILFVVTIAAALLTKFAVAPFLGVFGMFVLGHQLVTDRGAIVPDTRRFLAVRGRRGARNLALVLLLLLSMAGLVERFGVNALRYGALEPRCEDVQSLDTCEHYPPWRRNQALAAAHEKEPLSASAATSFLTRHWTGEMQRNATMVGVKSTEGYTSTFGPHVTGWVVLVGAPLLVAAVGMGLAKHGVGRGTWMLWWSTVAFVGSLFLFNLSTFLKYGIPIAVQARYLLTILPFLFAFLSILLTRAIGRSPNGSFVALGAVVVIAAFATQGAGMASFFQSSDATWWIGRTGDVPHKIADVISGVTSRVIIPDTWISDPRFPGS